MVGLRGEALVAQHLQQRGWELVAHRWRTREAEVDWIARQGQTLIFVEVKTRKSRNWDADGRLAVSRRKQQQMALGAAQFLAQHPAYAQCTCRFDVAIVRATPEHCVLVEYLENAFESPF